jgi:dTDP-L-rhamnose 4-epimerase
VRDVASATVAALDSANAPGTLQAYNVGSGTPRTVGDMATALSAAVAGLPPRVSGEFRLGDVRHITADSVRLRNELHWAPSVEFSDGVAELARVL